MLKMTDEAPTQLTTIDGAEVPQWVHDLQLKLHGMTDEELLRFRVIAEINEMRYVQEAEPELPEGFWPEVWFRTFELWCARNGFPAPSIADLYDNAKTRILMPSKLVH
jgi:hypothetical protein